MYNNKNINYNKGQFSSGDELSEYEYSGYNDVIFDNSGSGSETIINTNIYYIGFSSDCRCFNIYV